MERPAAKKRRINDGNQNKSIDLKNVVQISDSDSDSETDDGDCVIVDVAKAPSHNTPAPTERIPEGKNSTSQSKHTSATASTAREGAHTGKIQSPVRLIKCNALPDEANHDCISLQDLIGAPDICEMWQFNFMIDMDFVMEHTHASIRHSVRANFVRQPSRDEGDRTKLCKSITIGNVVLHLEPMFAAYGTHHSKIMVIFFEDQTMQVVIHTANMIAFDWGNMTQGAWVSPRLERLDMTSKAKCKVGTQFGTDFKAYFAHYKNPKVKELAKALDKYDFSPVKAILVASAPGSYKPGFKQLGQWGVTRLQREISEISQHSCTSGNTKYLVAQASSIATLGGANDTYLGPILCEALDGNSILGKKFDYKSRPLKLIFPTVKEVAGSLYGYQSGGSIHFKRETDAQRRQLDYLKPHLCTWTSEKAGRQKCAPHIKTYARVNDDDVQSLDYFLLTSANVSKQAWGTYSEKNGQYIQSWECGVLIHPGLFEKDSRLVPVYRQDSLEEGARTGDIPIRMPYDLQPIPYDFSQDQIWSPNDSYKEPDWLGNIW